MYIYLSLHLTDLFSLYYYYLFDVLCRYYQISWMEVDMAFDTSTNLHQQRSVQIFWITNMEHGAILYAHSRVYEVFYTLLLLYMKCMPTYAMYFMHVADTNPCYRHHRLLSSHQPLL